LRATAATRAPPSARCRTQPLLTAAAAPATLAAAGAAAPAGEAAAAAAAALAVLTEARFRTALVGEALLGRFGAALSSVAAARRRLAQ